MIDKKEVLEIVNETNEIVEDVEELVTEAVEEVQEFSEEVLSIWGKTKKLFLRVLDAIKSACTGICSFFKGLIKKKED